MSTAIKRVRSVPRLAARAIDAHKGSFGRVLVIGGSTGMIGAPALVGLAALRSGAGLVTIAVPAGIQPAVATLCPCATTIPLPQTSIGQIDPAAARQTLKAHGLLDPAPAGTPPDVLVVGPGVGRGPTRYGRQLWELINAFRSLRASRSSDGGPGVPAVIDADALNLSERGAHSPAAWDNQAHFRTVITPHPGELARMTGASTREVQADREGFALQTARRMIGQNEEPDYQAVVVLKGAGTVVTDGARLYVNDTGNPGMATGGSGDVLAGMIGALIGQGMTPFDAAVVAVHTHGLAGDLAAHERGQVSLIATDLIDTLPAAFLQVTNRPQRHEKQ